MRKVTASLFSTLDSVDQWSNSALIKGSVADFIADLRQRDGGTIGTGGSPSLVRWLFDQGLLDELTLMIEAGPARFQVGLSTGLVGEHVDDQRAHPSRPHSCRGGVASEQPGRSRQGNSGSVSNPPPFVRGMGSGPDQNKGPGPDPKGAGR